MKTSQWLSLSLFSVLVLVAANWSGGGSGGTVIAPPVSFTGSDPAAVVLSVKGAASQSAKIFSIERSSNTDKVWEVDNNGSQTMLGDLTINNIKTTKNTNMTFSNDVSGIAWELGATTAGVAWNAMVKLRTPRDDTRVLILRRDATQSVPVLEIRDEDETVRATVSEKGLWRNSSYADSALPTCDSDDEGSMLWNTTDNETCYCDTTWKRMDDGTDCASGT